MSLFESLFSPGHSIAWSFLSQYPHLFDALSSIHSFILSCPKDGLREIAENIWVGDDAVIAPTALINAPCIIGEGTEIRHGAFIRGNAVIGKYAVIGNSVEVKNAIISDEAEVPHFNYVGDSILGYKAHMGAGAITSNVRSDRKAVVMHLPEGDVFTGRMKVGAFIGDRAEIGCNTVLNPGSVIFPDASVYPLSSVRGFVPASCIYKADGTVVSKR